MAVKKSNGEDPVVKELQQLRKGQEELRDEMREGFDGLKQTMDVRFEAQERVLGDVARTSAAGVGEMAKMRVLLTGINDGLKEGFQLRDRVAKCEQDIAVLKAKTGS